MTSPEDESDEEGGDGSGETPYPSGRNGSVEGTARAGGEPPDDGDGDGADYTPWYRRMNYGKRLVFPGLTLLFLIVILLSFQKILLPFIFACAIVYLMEPIVVRLSRSPEDPQGLPRWITVILVYLVFFGVVTGAGALIIPRFVSEVVQFAESAPEGVQKFRDQKLPNINQRVQGYLEMLVPADSSNERIDRARQKVQSARSEATERARALAAARASVERASTLDLEWRYRPDGVRHRQFEPRGPPVSVGTSAAAAHGSWEFRSAEEEPAFVIQRAEDQGYEVFVNQGAVEVEKAGEEAWRVRRAPAEAGRGGSGAGETLRGHFDLEERIDRAIEEAGSFSHEQVVSVIEFAQHLVVGILEGLIAIILTLMVAAFISIDLPRFMGFFRSLVPDDLRGGYDELLHRVDVGLSGVIRGQLIICVVNGIFTFIGLWIFDVKFKVLLAVIAGVFSIIPVFGTVISTIPICLIAMTQSFMTAVLVLGWILLIHFIEGNILNPKIIGTSAEIHPVIVIFALLAGESTYGLVGAILGVPVASICLSVFKFVRDKVWDEDGDEYPGAEKSLNQS